MVYLMRDEKRNYCNWKVGFTMNLDKRMRHYATHNPEAELVSTVVTYSKTYHQLESAIKEELRQAGFLFLKGVNNDIATEWFSVPYDCDFQKELEEKGLGAFKACKYRKVLRA